MVTGREPFFRAVVAASVAHGAAIGALLASAVSNDWADLNRHVEAPSPSLVDIDLAIFEAIAHVASPGVESREGGLRLEAGSLARPSTGRLASANDRMAPYGLSSDLVESALSGEESAPPEVAPMHVDDAQSLTLDQLGIAGPARLALRSSPEAPAARKQADIAQAPSADGVLQSMRQLAQDHDRKVGLGAGGTVATALESVVYQSSKLVVGKASFAAVVIDNRVSDISVVTAQSENPSDWDIVARNAVARLAKQRVRVPPGRRGVVLVIQVESRVALPSGHDPGLEVTVGPALVQRGQGSRSARLGILVPNTSAPEEIEARNRSGGLPSPVGGVNLISTDIDPVDLGAKGRHVVHAHIVDEKVLD